MTDPTVPADQPAIEVVASRLPDGHGFNLKVRESGRIYRFEPVRDPRQPRFWCFRIYRCLTGGMPDPTERPWFGGGGMTRDELPGAAAAIRADVVAWLDQEANGPLRAWILGGEAGKAEPASTAGRAGRNGRGTAARPTAAGSLTPAEPRAD